MNTNIYIHIIVWIIILLSFLSFFSLAPWVPTKTSDLKRINTLSRLKKGEKFLEIWCWTASVSLYIAKQNPQSQITWIELSVLFYCISKIRVYLSRVKNIQIQYWNALKINMRYYDVIYVFWLPETISEKLAPKLKKELKIWAKFLSYCFKMNTKDFDEKKDKPDNSTYAIYTYKLKQSK